jgi:hypothetical protein
MTIVSTLALRGDTELAVLYTDEAVLSEDCSLLGGKVVDLLAAVDNEREELNVCHDSILGWMGCCCCLRYYIRSRI